MDWSDVVFFGMGCAVGVGPEPAQERPALRRLHSVSRAFCDAAERGAVAAPEDRQPMGFAIPKL